MLTNLGEQGHRYHSYASHAPDQPVVTISLRTDTTQSECLPERIAKEVENAQVDDHKPGPEEVMPIFNGQTEELMKAVPVPYNIRLARRRFLKLISQGLDIRVR